MRELFEGKARSAAASRREAVKPAVHRHITRHTSRRGRTGCRLTGRKSHPDSYPATITNEGEPMLDTLLLIGGLGPVEFIILSIPVLLVVLIVIFCGRPGHEGRDQAGGLPARTAPPQRHAVRHGLDV